jgi:hypothetical protein
VGASWGCEHRFALAAVEINRFLDALLRLGHWAQIGWFGALASKALPIYDMLQNRSRAGQLLILRAWINPALIFKKTTKL